MAFIADDSKTYKKTISSDNAHLWKKAMIKHFADLDKLKIWDLVNLPPNRKAINGRWTYVIKPKKEGELQGKKKARWIAKEFQQIYGLDYMKTYAHTAKPILFQLLFAYSAFND